MQWNNKLSNICAKSKKRSLFLSCTLVHQCINLQIKVWLHIFFDITLKAHKKVYFHVFNCFFFNLLHCYKHHYLIDTNVAVWQHQLKVLQTHFLWFSVVVCIFCWFYHQHKLVARVKMVFESQILLVVNINAADLGLWVLLLFLVDTDTDSSIFNFFIKKKRIFYFVVGTFSKDIYTILLIFKIIWLYIYAYRSLHIDMAIEC